MIKLSGIFYSKLLEWKDLTQSGAEWVKIFIKEGNVGIKVNDQVGPYFQTTKGFKQGDPLSSILFTLWICWQSLCLRPKRIVK